MVSDQVVADEAARAARAARRQQRQAERQADVIEPRAKEEERGEEDRGEEEGGDEEGVVTDAAGSGTLRVAEEEAALAEAEVERRADAAAFALQRRTAREFVRRCAIVPLAPHRRVAPDAALDGRQSR